MVECNLAKVDVAGSNPVSRSIPLEQFNPPRRIAHRRLDDGWIPFVVHTFHPVLAAGPVRVGPLSDRLAAPAALPAGGNRGGRGSGIGLGVDHITRPRTSPRLSPKRTTNHQPSVGRKSEKSGLIRRLDPAPSNPRTSH